MTRRLIIDTDIGTDVDDLWTLAMLPRLDGVVVEAVTVVYGDTDLRARLASVVLSAMGLDVPVYRGCEQPLSGKAVMWAGHEGDGVAGLDDARYRSGDAVDVLIERAAIDPGTLDILAIGPLTNIATAIGRDPMFVSNVRRLTVMGGEFAIGRPEHNFASDATAVGIVLASGMPMTIMPLDQTLRVSVGRADTERMAIAHPLGVLMADQAQRFWAWLIGVVPNLPSETSCAHDPAALLALIEPSLFTCTAMAVELTTEVTGRGGGSGVDGRVTGTPDPASSIDVVTDLDPVAVHDAFMRTLGCTEPTH